MKIKQLKPKFMETIETKNKNKINNRTSISYMI
jgi:hypothetical protein